MDASRASWRDRLHEIIFEADTPAGKAFDVGLLWCILLSVAAVMAESVPTIAAQYRDILRVVEWVFTIAFTVEYVLRLLCVRRPLRYAVSFFGLVDLGAILPTYLSLLLPGAQTLLVIRAFRLLRVFRVLKLVRFLDEGQVLGQALWASRHKIILFLGTVLIIAVTFGSLMHLIEGGDNGFDSAPRGAYWAIVTMTTVGYGDIAPETPLGQVLAGALMILGYAILAVPMGIFSVALAQTSRAQVTTRACEACGADLRDADARFCKYCGARLDS